MHSRYGSETPALFDDLSDRIDMDDNTIKLDTETLNEQERFGDLELSKNF